MIQKRIVVVIGSSGGLGSRLSSALENENEFSIIRVSRSSIQFNGKSISMEMDTRDPDSLNHIFSFLEEKFGQIWAIIDSTGITYAKKFMQMSEFEVRNQIEVNLLGSLNVIKVGLDNLQRGDGGRLISFSSVLSTNERPGTSIYAATKIALEKSIRLIARELDRPNLTLNCIRLGYFDFGLIERVPPKLLEGAEKANKRFMLGVVEDILPTIKVLLSPNSSFINGAITEVSGGYFLP